MAPWSRAGTALRSPWKSARAAARKGRVATRRSGAAATAEQDALAQYAFVAQASDDPGCRAGDASASWRTRPGAVDTPCHADRVDHFDPVSPGRPPLKLDRRLFGVQPARARPTTPRTNLYQARQRCPGDRFMQAWRARARRVSGGQQSPALHGSMRHWLAPPP